MAEKMKQEVVPLDVTGKWPTGTWFQHRLATVRMRDSYQKLNCEGGFDRATNELPWEESDKA